jgi:hypothetical protein
MQKKSIKDRLLGKIRNLYILTTIRLTNLKRKIPDEWWIVLVGICLIALELVVNG